MRRSPFCAGALLITGAALGASGPAHVRVGLSNSIASFDPRQSVDANFRAMSDLIHCSLMRFDSEGRLVRGIAADEPVWTSPQVLEVKVQGAVKFSDGRPLTAADVVATYKSVLTAPAFAKAALFRSLNEVRESQGKVVFTLKQADPEFISKLALGIIPANLAQQSSIDFLKMPVCGAYFISERNGERIVLEQNQHASHPRPPAIQQITFQIVRDEKQRFAQLQRGEIDLVQSGLTPEALKNLAKSPLLTVIKRKSPDTTRLAFQMNDPLAGHPAVQEAIALTLNRALIIQNVLAGLASPLAPDAGSDGSARAEKLLDDAGFKKTKGQRFELSYKTRADVMDIQIAKALAAQLKKIGIKLRVEALDAKTLAQDIGSGRFQLWCEEGPTDVQEKGKISLWQKDEVAVVNRRLKGYAVDTAGRYTGLMQASFSDQDP